MLSRIPRVERGRETGGITKYTGEQKEQGVFLESPADGGEWFQSLSCSDIRAEYRKIIKGKKNTCTRYSRYPLCPEISHYFTVKSAAPRSH